MGPCKLHQNIVSYILCTLVCLLAKKKSSSLRHYISICIVLPTRAALDKNTHYNHTIDAHAYMPSNSTNPTTT